MLLLGQVNVTDICIRLPQLESLTLACWIPLDCDALGVSSMDELLSIDAEHDSYVDGIYALPGQCTRCIDAFKSCILNAELRAVYHMTMDCPNLQTIITRHVNVLFYDQNSRRVPVSY